MIGGVQQPDEQAASCSTREPAKFEIVRIAIAEPFSADDRAKILCAVNQGRNGLVRLDRSSRSSDALTRPGEATGTDGGMRLALSEAGGIVVASASPTRQRSPLRC
jgi:hypothetical protein